MPTIQDLYAAQQQHAVDTILRAPVEVTHSFGDGVSYKRARRTIHGGSTQWIIETSTVCREYGGSVRTETETTLNQYPIEAHVCVTDRGQLHGSQIDVAYEYSFDTGIVVVREAHSTYEHGNCIERHTCTQQARIA